MADQHAQTMNEVTSPAWMVGVPPGLIDRSTVDYEFQEYRNQSSNTSGATNYRLYTTDTTSYLYLPSAHLEVEFQIKASDSGVTAGNQTALASNGWSLFENAKLKIGDELVAQLDKPAKAVHPRILAEYSREYMQTVAQKSHHFCDEKSDLGDATTVDRVDGSAASADGTYPSGLYDEVQFLVSSNEITNVFANDNYDPAFRSKVNRCTAEGATGNGGDLNTIASTAAKQRILLPLSEAFPLLGQYSRVVKGSKLEIELNKISSAAEAVFGATDTANVSVSISEIALWVARVKPSLSAMKLIESQIAESPVVNVNYHNMKYYSQTNVRSDNQGENTWTVTHKQNRPSHCYLFFQRVARDSNSNLNPLEFDYFSQINRVEMRINGRQVPHIAYTNDAQVDRARIVHELQRIAGKDRDPADSCCVNYDSWGRNKALYGFDFSHLEGSAYESTSTAEIEVRWNQSADTPSNYNVGLVMFSQANAL